MVTAVLRVVKPHSKPRRRLGRCPPWSDHNQQGFIVDQTFADQTRGIQERFSAFTSTSELFLPGGDVPEVGSRFRNRDLARTYHLLQRKGFDGFYTGELAASPNFEPPATHKRVVGGSKFSGLGSAGAQSSNSGEPATARGGVRPGWRPRPSP